MRWWPRSQKMVLNFLFLWRVCSSALSIEGQSKESRSLAFRCPPPIDAGYGAWPDLFEPARGGTWDALVVECVDTFSEGLRGMFAQKDAWELLKKGTFTVAASEAAAANAQAGEMPETHHMANAALISTFTLNAGTITAGADWRPPLWRLKV